MSYVKISIHALHTECDQGCFQRDDYHDYFNPRTPYRVRLKWIKANRELYEISIHALHTECDFDGTRPGAPMTRISIHALHTECDIFRSGHITHLWVFQSTHSIQSATRSQCFRKYKHSISIHALHTECDRPETGREGQGGQISIHALHTECDRATVIPPTRGATFQSTHSIQSATCHRCITGLASLPFQSTHSIQSATTSVRHH